MQYAAPLDTAQVCLTGLRISHIIGHMIPDYSNSTVTWEYKDVPTKDLRVVYFQFVYPTLGNTVTHKWVLDMSISLSYIGGSPPPHNGGNRATLTNR